MSKSFQHRRRLIHSSHGHWGFYIVKSQSLISKPWLTDSLVRFAVAFILPLILETDLANYPIWQTQSWHGINSKILLDSLLSHCAQQKLDTAVHLAPKIQIASCFLFLGGILQRWLQLQTYRTPSTLASNEQFLKNTDPAFLSPTAGTVKQFIFINFILLKTLNKNALTRCMKNKTNWKTLCFW